MIKGALLHLECPTSYQFRRKDLVQQVKDKRVGEKRVEGLQIPFLLYINNLEAGRD